MNELSLIFHQLNIDTLDVLEAAGTKWNFLNFRPGLVGGHCIGVDPYYLTYRAQEVGYHPQIILAGRRINDNMGKFIAGNAIKQLIKLGNDITNIKIAVLGFSFKENCPDTRNTRVIDIVEELKSYGITPTITDPVADKEEAKLHYDINFTELDSIDNYDCIIVAVAHNEFVHLKMDKLVKPAGLIVDVKGIFNSKQLKKQGFNYWRL